MTMQVDFATGLSRQITDWLRNEVQRFPDVRVAYLFGSCARGDYSPQSDIDIAIDAPDMSPDRFAQLWSAMDELPIAFPLDCVWMQSLPESTLKAQIVRDARAL
jgi:predicted nucleotidyltransferase